LINWVKNADVLHFHDDSYPTGLQKYLPRVDLKGKILVYQAHIGSIPDRYFHRPRTPRYVWNKNMAHAAITNGYGHIFDEDEKISNGSRKWGRLPDILELDHPTYAPDPSIRAPLDGPLDVVYTYSNSVEDGKINAKRPKAHGRLASKIPGVRFTMVCNKPFGIAMALKKRAHVVLEEVFSPYLHLSALEGAAVGAMVMTNFNKATIHETSSAIGAPASEWPFFLCTERNLRAKLEHIRDNRELVTEWGDRARAWATSYYTAPRLLKKYLEFYEYAKTLRS
jgi:hypothetical protein